MGTRRSGIKNLRHARASRRTDRQSVITSDLQKADVHLMYTVRECARRYRGGGGRTLPTTEFHCWKCGQRKRGDSWHCIYHQADYCQDCEGGISRHCLPRRWDDIEYVQERVDYDPPLTCTDAEIDLLRRDIDEALAEGKELELRHDRPGYPGDLRERLAEVGKGK